MFVSHYISNLSGSTQIATPLQKITGLDLQRKDTVIHHFSDCSGSGMDPAPTKPDSAPTRAQDYVPYYVQLSSTMQADSLVEWQYPPDTGDWYLLQEQVKDYLQARNFHRRYVPRLPGLSSSPSDCSRLAPPN